MVLGVENNTVANARVKNYNCRSSTKQKEKTMKKLVALSAVVVMLSGCADMTRREQNMYVGAVIGSIFWIPGAALGGFIGHQMR